MFDFKNNSNSVNGKAFNTINAQLGIPVTSDDKLVKHGTTEIDCQCPGLKYKSDIHICPYTGDRICRHIYRFRMQQRLNILEAQFHRVSRIINRLYGEKAYHDFLNEPPIEMIALKSELAKAPEPKVKKAKSKVTPLHIVSIWDELQELKIC